MELIPINATNIAEIGYEPETMLMQIRFRNGWLYSYANVEPETYSAFQSSDDPGRYFAEIIKPQRNRYVFTRLA